MENEIVPKQQNERGSGAQEFFLYLLSFLSLGFISFAVGSILFQYIDKFLADSRIGQFFIQEAVKFGIAAIFIAAPIFFFLSRLLNKRIANGKISLDSPVRKWLTYIVLFIAASTIIGDLITLVISFLGGDFPASFLLKVLVVLLIAGAIFGYYFWDMRRAELDSKINRLSGYSAAAACALVFVAAFFIIDSPIVSRQKRVDQQIVGNIQTVDASIQGYFADTKNLPASLTDLQQTRFSFDTRNVTGITYKILSNDRYQLCADFTRSSLNDQQPPLAVENQWRHASGHVCFERVALSGNNSTNSIMSK